MKKIYHFDPVTLKYKPAKGYFLRMIKMVLITSLMFFSLGYFLAFSGNSLTYIVDYQTKTLPIGSDVWKDSVFSDYEKRAKIYLTSKYPNSPIEPGMLALAAHNAYDSTGILVPVEFALTQAQLESSMGTKGRSPVNNPFNIGEYDSGTVMWFDSTFDGIQAYYYFVTRNYLKCKSLDMLFKNYTNCNGHRYASKPTYEVEVKKQYLYILNFIDKKISSKESKNKKIQ